MRMLEIKDKRKCTSCGSNEYFMFFCRICKEESEFYKNQHCHDCCLIHESIEHPDTFPVSTFGE